MRRNFQTRRVLIMCSFMVAFGIQERRYRRQPFGVEMCFDLCAKHDGCCRPVFIRDTLVCITQNITDTDKDLGFRLKMNKCFAKDNSSVKVEIKPKSFNRKGRYVGPERIAACSKYGSSMTPYPGLGIKNHNRKQIKVSRMQCVIRCIKETSFTCVSVDTHSDLTCNLQQYGYRDVAEKYRLTKQKGWVLYERNCAP